MRILGSKAMKVWMAQVMENLFTSPSRASSRLERPSTKAWRGYIDLLSSAITRDGYNKLSFVIAPFFEFVSVWDSTDVGQRSIVGIS